MVSQTFRSVLRSSSVGGGYLSSSMRAWLWPPSSIEDRPWELTLWT